MDILQFIFDVISAAARHGLSVTTLVLVIVALFRIQIIRNKLLRRLPKRFRHEDRLTRVEAKLDAVMAAGGIKWGADLMNGYNAVSQTAGAQKNLTSSRAAYVRVVFTKLFIPVTGIFHLIRRMKMSKFKSRKFWMSVIAALLVVANEGLDLGISSETVMTFAALVASFIFSEAYVDGKKKPEVSAYDAKALDSVRENSEGA